MGLRASLLRSEGLEVGVYSSPHLLRYNERVQLGGVNASDEQLCEAFAAVDGARGDISLTYFEVGTLAAFWLFERAGLDAVVLEVGLGGRLDAVNIIDADLAVITNIGLDHADWLELQYWELRSWTETLRSYIGAQGIRRKTRSSYPSNSGSSGQRSTRS